MRIVLASSEAVPFAKTGGLADVAAALPKALKQSGHEVTLIIPYHRRHVARSGLSAEATGHRLHIPVGGKRVTGEVFASQLPQSDVSVLLVDQPAYFDREDLYVDKTGKGHTDNCERFVFFSRAVLDAVAALAREPDVLHANDWQTGLVPALLEIEHRSRGSLAHTASVMTIHNMAFQGSFWHWDMLLTGLDWKYFNWKQMEFFHHLNLLKTGIAFADFITTVSPTYAREIQTPEFGCGLHGVLHARQDRLAGILNGIDPGVWNPAVDPHIAQNYSAAEVAARKAACKEALQKRLALPPRPEVPLFAMISRMTDQKGFDLIEACIEEALRHEIQIAFLGTGESRYETMLSELADHYPSKVAAVIGFDEPLAHQLEAGADAYLMPSQFEPCGLNQMYSLAYGTVPLVHAVGGLADTVVGLSPETLADGTANGFSFTQYNANAFLMEWRRVIETYDDRATWNQLVQNGMQRDWSWRRSAAEYVSVYERALAARREPTAAT